MAPRTSRQASSITRAVGRGWESCLFSRSRRTMFSTPITASATTTPIGMARPPSVMVLSVAQSSSSQIVAARSEIGMQHNTVSLQTWPQVLKCRFDRLRHLDRVGAVLFRNVEDHAGFALNRGAANQRFGRLDDISDIGQRDACGSLAQQHGPRDGVCGQRLPFGLEHDSLALAVDEAGAADTRCARRAAVSTSLRLKPYRSRSSGGT